MSKKIPIKKFSFRIIVFSAAIAGLSVLFQWLCPNYTSPALPFIILFFFAITLFTIYIVLRDDRGKTSQRFVSNYLLSRVVKLFSCLLFLSLYMILNRPDALRFAISFIIIYFLYSAFEVFVLKKENSDLTEAKSDRDNIQDK